MKEKIQKKMHDINHIFQTRNRIKWFAAGSNIILFICVFVSVLSECGCLKLNGAIFDCMAYICPKSKENLISAFNTLWSVAVTVTIFVLEFSEEYKYGVPLKRIVYEAVGALWLIISISFFLILFPLFFIFMKLDFLQSGVWCLLAAFVMFAEITVFFSWMYKGKHIRTVIREKTLEQIREISKEKEKSEDEWEQVRLHERIDDLAISDMLDHADYGNVDEVSGLVGMCKDIFISLEFWEELQNIALENLVITTWVDHIIHSCNWNTEYERTQNINTLHLLWKTIMATIDRNDENADRIEISVCLQFLQSFVNENNAGNDRILVRVWKEFEPYRKQTLVCLLLYTTYRSYRLETANYAWFLRNEPVFRTCMQEIVNGRFRWDETFKAFALQCWIDWSRYECRNDIELMQFRNFSDDMGKLQRGKQYEVVSPVIIQLIGGVQ